MTFLFDPLKSLITKLQSEADSISKQHTYTVNENAMQTLHIKQLTKQIETMEADMKVSYEQLQTALSYYLSGQMGTSDADKEVEQRIRSSMNCIRKYTPYKDDYLKETT